MNQICGRPSSNDFDEIVLDIGRWCISPSTGRQFELAYCVYDQDFDSLPQEKFA